MFESIFYSAKAGLSGKIIEKMGLNLEETESSIEIALESLIKSLKKQILEGNISQVINLIEGKIKPSNHIAIVGFYTRASYTISQKLGLNSIIAWAVAVECIPVLILNIKKILSSDGSITAEDVTDAFIYGEFSAQKVRQPLPGVLKEKFNLLKNVFTFY